MVDNQQIDYTENTFYRTFPQHSFASRIARWVKAFSYSFIALSIFSIILEYLQHYCITPPGMFFQFLFALLMAGIIEVICIQMSNVSDHTVLDYAKNLITVIQHRFVLRKVVILASFEQVRVIGVSSRPPTLLGHLFANPLKRYALVIMNYRNHLIHITEYDMTLEDANELATELASRHMPSARFITGEPDTELVADALTGDVSTRPVKHSLAAMIDATILPALQAFCALMITAALVSITMLAISRISTRVFDTDLLVAHQPVTQLFLRPGPRIDKTAGQAEPDAGNPASGTVAITVPISAASATALLPSPAASETAPVPAVTDQPDSTQPMTVLASESGAVETVLYQASETVQPEPPLTADNSGANSLSETASATSEAAAQPEKPEIPASTPIAAEATSPANTPVEPARPIPEKFDLKRPVSKVAPPEMTSGLIPVNDSLAVRIPAVSASAMQSYSSKSSVYAAIPASASAVLQQPASLPAKPARECSILAGFGLHPLVNLGEIENDLEATLGKPLAMQKTVSGIQKVYNGFTILADEQGKVVKQIIITRKTINKVFVCQTPQQISVGSSLELLRTRFGPPTLLAAIPGLHFPGLGISFIPSPTMPDKIGAIKIYPIGTRPE